MSKIFAKLDSNKIPRNKSEVCLFVATKNNEKTLPAFFKHYRSIGVDRFFVIDNMSKDRTLEFLLDQKSTHVFLTNAPYRKRVRRKTQNWNRWINNKLKKYTMGNWCIVADSDEFLTYPHYESHNIKEVIGYLEKEGSVSMRGILVDMYSKGPVSKASYEKGGDIFKTLPFFDYPCHKNSNPRRRAMKRRIRLSKCPLFKCLPKSIVKTGHHSVINEKASSTISCAVLHFKFTSDYIDHLILESKNKSYYGKSMIKKKMRNVFYSNPDFSFFCKKSKEYKGSQQLLDLGIMKIEGNY